MSLQARLNGGPDLRKSPQSLFDCGTRQPHQENPLGQEPAMKHEIPEVLVVGYEDPCLDAGVFQKDFRITRKGLGSIEHIMAAFAQPLDEADLKILVGQEAHALCDHFLSPEDGCGIEHGGSDVLGRQARVASKKLHLGHPAPQFGQDVFDGDPGPLKYGLSRHHVGSLFYEVLPVQRLHLDWILSPPRVCVPLCRRLLIDAEVQVPTSGRQAEPQHPDGIEEVQRDTEPSHDYFEV